MRILITGREGQVVRSLLERATSDLAFEMVALGRPELDLRVPGSANEAVRTLAPDIVVSAAAYTAVDQAEDEPEVANRVNGEAAGELAAAAAAVGAPILHLSTDYVFGGDKSQPYREDDQVAPIGAYGRSKLLGEERVRAANPDHLILRTAWVYSPWGRNFLKTMLILAQTREEVPVVADQHGNPTSALDIADGVLTVLANWASGGRSGLGKTFHLAGTGSTSWFGFATWIFQECARLGLPSAKARPIATAEFPTKARRPAHSLLDSTKFATMFGYRAPDWRISATNVLLRSREG
jgi:dTDP-4-dehydrorhamnose reductase